ncbi:hypothetical protein DQW50_09185 [Halorubrum sp. 48-1-W]|uniref:hypothetical protein n=1 Tax=Halorubrum sp. 48-1-W TaxID=2249761 RepID=UPI000DCC8ED4|nr:hypothetical protein [Halorubrum sp. 48-1-W]RAW45502.1 hypothetical protein DQW50_09185 [Halorubrum sp. 48-1-W]
MNVPPSIETSDRSTVRGLVRVVLAVSLVGLVFFYPGAMSSPYSETGLDGYYDNRIVEQASDVGSIEHAEVTDETSVYRYSELSPAAKDVFDETRSAEDDSFTIRICHDWTLVCDEYYESDVPAEFRYGAVGHNVDEDELYAVIVDDGRAYVLQTGALGHGDGWDLEGLPLMILSSLMLLSVSGVLFHNTVFPPNPDGNGFASYDIAFGFLIGVFALAVPYLHMGGILTVSQSRTLTVGAVAVGLPTYYSVLR